MSWNGNTEASEVLKGKVTDIPAVDKTLTKEGLSADAKATGDALNKKVGITDIIDNLTTDAADKPLSAKQGVALKRQIDDVDPHYAENVQYDNSESKLNAWRLTTL